MNYSKPRREEPMTGQDLEGQVEEQIQKRDQALTTTTPPLRPSPVMSSGAEQLVVAAEKAITGAHDAVIGHIDEMIGKLQSVKESIKAKRDGAVAQLTEFVNLSALGLESVRDLDKKVQELIKKHLRN